MKTTDGAGAPDDPAAEEIEGVSLRRYACVYAGTAEGFELPEVLENEGIDARRWPAIDRAWMNRIADDHEAEARMTHPFDALLLEAQREYARAIPPLDEDPQAFFDFMRIWPQDPEPLALLERLGLRPNDVVRLQRAWSEKVAADEKLRERVQEILMEDTGPMPEIAPEPPRLPPREHTAKKPQAPATAAPEPAAEAAPPAPPGLAVPLPREGDDAAPPIAVPSPPLPAPPLPLPAPPVAPPVIAVAPGLNSTTTGVMSPFAEKLPFKEPAPAPERRSVDKRSLIGLPFNPFAQEPAVRLEAAPLPEPGQVMTKDVALTKQQIMALRQAKLADDAAAMGAPPSNPVPPPPPSSPRALEPEQEEDGTSVAVPSPFQEKALPFTSLPPTPVSAPAVPQPPPSNPGLLPGDVPAPSSARVPQADDPRFAAWKLEQYASLCAELSVFTSDTETTFKRYGLHTADDRTALDRFFRRRLSESADVYAEWQALYWRFRNHWSANPRR